jgi:hypothetical protein
MRKDNQIYKLTSKQNETLKPGERVELQGKKVKNDSGDPMFEVRKMFEVPKVSKDLGQCTTTKEKPR